MADHIIGNRKFNRVSNGINSSGASGNAGVEDAGFGATGSEHQSGGDDNQQQPDTHGDTGSLYTDPASLTAANDHGSTGKRKRGRPAGSRNSTSTGSTKSKRDESKTADFIAKIMMTTHTMVASIAHFPELALSEQESKDITKAVLHVSEIYGVGNFMDEKTEAWANLALVAGGVYGPKVVHGLILKKKGAATGPQVMRPSPMIPKSEPMPSWMGGGKQVQ